MNGPATLLAVPHAGGSCNAFLPLAERLEERSNGLLRLHGVELPGHGRRMGDPLLADIRAMARDVLPSLLPLLAAPYAVFGHSMGALAAYQLLLEVREQGLPLPRRLFVSGCSAPGLSRLSPEVAALPGEAFWRHVSRYGGLPQGLREDPELLAVFEPILRADFLAVAAYRQRPGEAALDVPITALCGRQDAISQEELAAWQAVTTAPLETHLFPGGHFYLLEHGAQLAEFLVRRCGGAPA